LKDMIYYIRQITKCQYLNQLLREELKTPLKKTL